MFFIAKDPVINILNHFKLLPQPERITELYFTEHTKLPKEYLPGQEQTVRFTVHNFEYEPIKYSYVIEQKNDTTQQQLAAGTVDTQFNDSKELSVRVIPVDMGERSQIAIKLSYDGHMPQNDLPIRQQRMIYYWITKQGEQ